MYTPSSMFDGAMYAQMAAAAAMGDLMRAGQTQAEEEAIETAEVHRKEEPEAPAAFDKDMLARLAKQAAEKEALGIVESTKPREPSPVVERQQAVLSEGTTPIESGVDGSQTFRLPAAFKKKMEKKAAETFPEAQADPEPQPQSEVQAFSTEQEEPERNIFREPSPEPVLIPVHPITLQPLKDGKKEFTGSQGMGAPAQQFGAIEPNNGGKGNSTNLRSIVDNVVGSLQKNLEQTVLSAKVAPLAVKPDSTNRPSSALLPKTDMFLPNAREPAREEEDLLPIIRPPPLPVDPDERKLSEAQRIAEQIEKNRKEEEEEQRKRRDRDRDRNRDSDRGWGSDRDRGSDRGSDRPAERGADRGASGRDRGEEASGGGARRFKDRDDDRGDRQTSRRSRSRSRRARRNRSRSKSRSPSRKRKRPNLFSAAPPEERISQKLSSGNITDRVAAVAEVSGYAGAVDPRSVSLKTGEVPDWLQDLASPVATSQPSGFYMGRKVLRMPGAYIKCLIGKGGETIRNIRTRTGADIKIEGKPDDLDGVVSIAGNIKVAENMIRDTLQSKGCIWEAQEGAGPLLGTTTTNVGWKNYDEMEDLKIPSQLVPLLIGNNGCGFKEIKARTGGHVTIKVLPNIWNDNTQSIQVVGDNWKVARQIIREKIDHIKKTTPGPWQAGFVSHVGQVEHRNLNANRHG